MAAMSKQPRIFGLGLEKEAEEVGARIKKVRGRPSFDAPRVEMEARGAAQEFKVPHLSKRLGTAVLVTRRLVTFQMRLKLAV
jgi:hypothetical protein